MTKYHVIFTTDDCEVVYPVNTTRGALAAVEAAMFLHHKNGHAPSTVRAVRTEEN
jgi:hypothetical protein